MDSTGETSFDAVWETVRNLNVIFVEEFCLLGYTNITPCTPSKINRCFGGSCWLCLQG
jgi:hypothetical protein